MIGVTLTKGAAVDVLAHIKSHAAAEVAANCEPSGFTLLIEVDANEGATAFLRIGSKCFSLGPANIDLGADNSRMHGIG